MGLGLIMQHLEKQSWIPSGEYANKSTEQIKTLLMGS